MARVSLDRLTKNFRDVKAVNDLSLEIDDKSFVTLLGPSGCGKSTTLNCIAGLDEPTSGDIRFDGERVNDLSPRDRNIAMVFQDYALYPHMPVYDNIAFGLRMRSLGSGEIRRRVTQVTEALGIGALLNRRPSQLSGGQRQRVALARAIARDPVVFLMDEPLSNLDAALRVNTRTEIKRLQRQLGTTTVFVTHDQEEAMVLSDRIAVMSMGLLQQYDTPDEIYNHPVNHFVAQFIGSPKMNFFEGRLERSDGKIHFSGPRIQFELSLEGPTGLILGNKDQVDQIILGIRPHDVALRRETNGEAAEWLDGTVVLTEPVGPVTYVDLEVQSQTLKVSVSPDLRVAPGENLRVRFNEPNLHLFDAATGRRLNAP